MGRVLPAGQGAEKEGKCEEELESPVEGVADGEDSCDYGTFSPLSTK